MSKKFIRLCLGFVLVTQLAACVGGVKKQYIVTEESSKRPYWVNIRDVDVLQKKLGSKDSYAIGDAESINKTICEKEAKAKGPVAFKEQITQSLQEQSVIKNTASDASGIQSDDKITKTVNAVAGRITGVKVKDTFWEKRQNSPKLGAADEKVFYHCYTLFSMDSKKLNELKDTVYNTYLREINVSGEQSIKDDFIDLGGKSGKFLDR
jgi:hypothetical protein